MNCIRDYNLVQYEKMNYRLNTQLNSKNKENRKVARRYIKNLNREEIQLLTRACLGIHEKANRSMKILECLPLKAIPLRMLTKKIAQLKPDEIFKGIFFHFENEWKNCSPTEQKLKSFIEENKDILSSASIKNPALWMALSTQIRNNPKSSMSTKLQLLLCDNKLLKLTNKQNFLIEAIKLLSDLKIYIINKIPYKTIGELSSNISKIFFINEFKRVDQFSNWIDNQKIPIQWLLSLEKGAQLPFPSKEWISSLKCLHVGLPLTISSDEIPYEVLAQASQKMKSVVEVNFDLAGGDTAAERFLTPFGKNNGNHLKAVHFFESSLWSEDSAKPLEKEILDRGEIEREKGANGPVYVPFISSLKKVETFSMKDFPMGIEVLSALPLSLKKLSISNCALNNEELFALKRLENLEILDLEWCPSVTADGIESLKAELPYLNILFN